MHNLMPTPVTDAAKWPAMDGGNPARITEVVDALLSASLERDCMVLALRLWAESRDTMADETLEVMKRWHPRCRALLEGKTTWE